MSEHKIVPTVHRYQPVTGRQINPHLPLFVAYLFSDQQGFFRSAHTRIS
jgi:hypothetical protein